MPLTIAHAPIRRTKAITVATGQISAIAPAAAVPDTLGGAVEKKAPSICDCTHAGHDEIRQAILAQGLWSAVLILSGTYESLIDYSLFGIWVFYGLMIAAVMVLRRTRPDLPRPYRMWGYPATPLAFLAITLWFLINMLVTRPGASFTSLGLMLTGVPAYFLWRRRGQRAELAKRAAALV